ncbi:TPA: prepilin-type N-terminal cleavage/methylation domain-containing protein [Enterobacter roggenkampii]|nr:prepilin-type N-terminal cleavage/methylation domain-containing protein [Enterobacter roggenkampii]
MNRQHGFTLIELMVVS